MSHSLLTFSMVQMPLFALRYGRPLQPVFGKGAVEGVDSISDGALLGEGGGEAISLSPVLLRVSR
jgi:hypothetical protein